MPPEGHVDHDEDEPGMPEDQDADDDDCPPVDDVLRYPTESL